ncbi:type II toxin-antitoxin system RelE/ParE family toxin [Robiginitalea sp. M366]|uniref:type II toxin-antitoxin system RelE/ParE family toxin n=1 Tax=Robiginitalea aestuariiviva TaxID=3036903 RepID=UPI00240DFD5A|nr:type II toxin-antitoxin system RelE/ParE family toxin [Robiginitalea aestuariiviva]MDG1572496.1 type II toxin-antitoxin system RelE/ParE family toxin [Robiginitalea aestuariiviva]
MAKYYLTNTAVEDLGNIWNYTLDEWSESQADKYYQGLVDCFQDLATNPELGKDYKGIASSLIRFPFNKQLIFYRIMDPDLIEITRILHGRMDLKVRFWEQ